MNRDRPGLKIIIAILMLIGFASGAYLTDLFVEVHNATGPVESFCAVSEGVNCITVSASQYSRLLGIPISVYGAEYFLLTLIILGISLFRRIKWESYIFWMMLLALPGCLALGLISAFLIESLCLLCLTVYAMCLGGVLVLGIANRRSFKALLVDGPWEFYDAIITHIPTRAIAVVAVVFLISEFVWVPPIFHCGCDDPGAILHGDYHGIPVSGLAMGNPNAPLKIQEFTDMQCPYCGKGHASLMALIQKYPDKVYAVHRDFPLDDACNPTIKSAFHPNACDAAVWGRCAARQNRFPDLVDVMFSNRQNLNPVQIEGYAKNIKGLDMKKLLDCVADPDVLKEVQADIADGVKRGVKGTPIFFVNGELVMGYKPLEFWEKTYGDILKAP